MIRLFAGDEGVYNGESALETRMSPRRVGVDGSSSAVAAIDHCPVDSSVNRLWRAAC